MSNEREEQRKTSEDAINRYFAILKKFDPVDDYEQFGSFSDHRRGAPTALFPRTEENDPHLEIASLQKKKKEAPEKISLKEEKIEIEEKPSINLPEEEQKEEEKIFDISFCEEDVKKKKVFKRFASAPKLNLKSREKHPTKDLTESSLESTVEDSTIRMRRKTFAISKDLEIFCSKPLTPITTSQTKKRKTSIFKNKSDVSQTDISSTFSDRIGKLSWKNPDSSIRKKYAQIKKKYFRELTEEEICEMRWKLMKKHREKYRSKFAEHFGPESVFATKYASQSTSSDQERSSRSKSDLPYRQRYLYKALESSELQKRSSLRKTSEQEPFESQSVLVTKYASQSTSSDKEQSSRRKSDVSDIPKNLYEILLEAAKLGDRSSSQKTSEQDLGTRKLSVEDIYLDLSKEDMLETTQEDKTIEPKTEHKTEEGESDKIYPSFYALRVASKYREDNVTENWITLKKILCNSLMATTDGIAIGSCQSEKSPNRPRQIYEDFQKEGGDATDEMNVPESSKKSIFKTSYLQYVEELDEDQEIILKEISNDAAKGEYSLVDLAKIALRNKPLQKPIFDIAKRVLSLRKDKESADKLFEWMVAKTFRKLTKKADLSVFHCLFTAYESFGYIFISKKHDYHLFCLLNFYYYLLDTRYRFGLEQKDLKEIIKIKNIFVSIMEKTKFNSLSFYKVFCSVCLLIAALIPDDRDDRTSYLHVIDDSCACNFICGLKLYHLATLVGLNPQNSSFMGLESARIYLKKIDYRPISIRHTMDVVYEMIVRYERSDTEESFNKVLSMIYNETNIYEANVLVQLCRMLLALVLNLEQDYTCCDDLIHDSIESLVTRRFRPDWAFTAMNFVVSIYPRLQDENKVKACQITWKILRCCKKVTKSVKLVSLLAHFFIGLQYHFQCEQLHSIGQEMLYYFDDVDLIPEIHTYATYMYMFMQEAARVLCPRQDIFYALYALYSSKMNQNTTLGHFIFTIMRHVIVDENLCNLAMDEKESELIKSILNLEVSNIRAKSKELVNIWTDRFLQLCTSIWK